MNGARAPGPRGHGPRPSVEGTAAQQLELFARVEPLPGWPPFTLHRRQRISVEYIVRRLLDGARTRALAKELGCHHGYIARIRNRYQIPNPPDAPHRREPPAEALDNARRRCSSCTGLTIGRATAALTCGHCGAPW